MSRSPTSVLVPYNEKITDNQGFVSRIWQNLFRSLKENIDGKFVAAQSSDFPLSTSGYATSEWAAMTGNYVDLTPGSWMLSGSILATWGSGSPTWTQLSARWSESNGNNTTTPVAAISSQAGRSSGGIALGSASETTYSMPAVRLAITELTRVYLVPNVVFSVAGDAFVRTNIFAERLSTSVSS